MKILKNQRNLRSLRNINVLKSIICIVSSGNHQALIDYSKKGKVAQLAIPTNEHYLPLLYTLALQDKKDQLSFFNEKTVMGSVSMRSVLLTS